MAQTHQKPPEQETPSVKNELKRPFLVPKTGSSDSSVTLQTSGYDTSSSDSDWKLSSPWQELRQKLTSASSTASLPSKSSLWTSPSDFPEEYISRPLDKNSVPAEFLQPGLEMLRVTHRKKAKRLVRLDMDKNRLYWNNKASSFLEIEKIKSIRVGDEARNYREEFKVSAEYGGLWITVIYHNFAMSNNIKALHLIATSQTDYARFLYTMSNLVYFRRQLQASLYSTAQNSLVTKFRWNTAQPSSDRLDFDGVLRLAAKLHINVESQVLRAIFERSDADKKGFLLFEEFKQFVKVLRRREEFSFIFAAYAADREHMSVDEFGHFLRECQHEEVDSDEARRIFAKFATTDSLTVDDFGAFLVSSYTSAFKAVAEDFSRPLNEYFVSSSHNTYLLGRQLKGVSSIEGYIRALQRGCRCVEVDVWDGDNGPVVTHGRTFSSSVDFQLVVEAIRKYSFITSPFPVIVSLEVRCSRDNQLQCVRILKEVLQDLLVETPLDDLEKETLPSPMALKHRILVKVKKHEDGDRLGVLTSSSLDDSSSSISKIIPSPKKTVPTIPELSALAPYTLGTKFRNFSLPESKTFNHCFSFTDRTVAKMLREPSKFAAIMKHNRRCLLRVYPSVYRFKSDNFCPLGLWSLGAQLAATNWQVYDAGQQLNEALFAVGDGAGYVLKPAALRLGREHFRKPEDFASVLSFSQLQYLDLTIVSAQQLPWLKDKRFCAYDPFVEVELYSGKVVEASVERGTTSSFTIQDPQIAVNEDCTACPSQPISGEQVAELANPSAVCRTSWVSKNGFNPHWNQTFRIKYYANREGLTFVRFLVKCNTHDHGDVLLGVHCCKLDYLRQGFRHLPLYDLQGEEFIYSGLFLHIRYGSM